MNWFQRIMQIIVAIAVLAVAAIVFLAGPTRSQPTALLPFATSVALAGTGTVVAIAGANPGRSVIQICNPSTIIETIAPTGITVSSAAAGITLPAVASGVTSCYVTPPGARAAGSAWTAVSASGTPNITVLEY
jgi:hypothetical protein